MPETTPLTTAVTRLADRLRALPESALRRGPEAQGRALARELARRAQRLEFPGAEPRELPDAGPFAVGDQLAVAGHDLVAALREVDATALCEADAAAPCEGAYGEVESAVALVEEADGRISDTVTSRR